MPPRPPATSSAQHGEPPAAGASDRLQLEAALLSAATALPAPAAPQPAAEVGQCRTVLTLVRDAELRAYVETCLRERGVLWVLTAGTGESALDAVRRLRPALLVAERRALEGDATSLPAAERPLPPVLLIAGEAEDAAAWLAWLRTPVEVLPLPFNARRLCEAVDRLLVG